MSPKVAPAPPPPSEITSGEIFSTGTFSASEMLEDEVSDAESSGGDSEAYPFTDPGSEDAMRQLSSVLSRHLSTLTSTISGYADLLTEPCDPEEQREIALNVMEATSRIDDLLAELRRYSQEFEVSPRTVSITSLTRGAASLLGKQERARVTWKVEPDATGKIEGDPQLLRQALLNLLKNALEAAEQGEVLLRATPAPCDEESGATSGSGNAAESGDLNVEFEVWNDGEVGLDDPSDAFQPFFTTRPQRLGLGLPMASQIAKKHGGELVLATNDASEGGTCFALRV